MGHSERNDGSIISKAVGKKNFFCPVEMTRPLTCIMEDLLSYITTSREALSFPSKKKLIAIIAFERNLRNEYLQNIQDTEISNIAI